MRLLAGSRSGTVLLGGIAIQLQPGWKTYWRTPGDSGVPPRFDFSKSDNVEAVTVLWPAPKKFDDGAGGIALGYKQQVVLPLRIVAKNADKPVTLRANINYAVCDKICIPVEAHAELAFASVASTEDGNAVRCAQYRAEARQCRRPQSADHPRRQARGQATCWSTSSAPDAREVSLFVEGPTPDWALPVPKLVEHSPPGVKRFAFELDGLPPGASRRRRRAQTDAGRRRPGLRIQCQFELALVVPAKRSVELRDPYAAAEIATPLVVAFFQTIAPCGYGSLRSQGRRRATPHPTES